MMPPRVSCLCGERLELEAGQALTRIDCPTCGRTIDLSPPQFDQPAAGPPSSDAAGPTPAGPAVVCPDCGGTGKCPLCTRSGELTWGGVLRAVDAVFDVLFGFFAEVAAESRSRRIGGGRHVSSRHYKSKVCVGCNGRQRCYKCRGTGAYCGTAE